MDKILKPVISVNFLSSYSKVPSKRDLVAKKLKQPPISLAHRTLPENVYVRNTKGVELKPHSDC